MATNHHGGAGYGSTPKTTSVLLSTELKHWFIVYPEAKIRTPQKVVYVVIPMKPLSIESRALSEDRRTYVVGMSAT